MCAHAHAHAHTHTHTHAQCNPTEAHPYFKRLVDEKKAARGLNDPFTIRAMGNYANR